MPLRCEHRFETTKPPNTTILTSSNYSSKGMSNSTSTKNNWNNKHCAPPQIMSSSDEGVGTETLLPDGSNNLMECNIKKLLKLNELTKETYLQSELKGDYPNKLLTRSRSSSNMSVPSARPPLGIEAVVSSKEEEHIPPTIPLPIPFHYDNDNCRLTPLSSTNETTMQLSSFAPPPVTPTLSLTSDHVLEDEFSIGLRSSPMDVRLTYQPTPHGHLNSDLFPLPPMLVPPTLTPMMAVSELIPDFASLDPGLQSGRNMSTSSSMIPKLQIGSFNLPTYGETDERFNRILMQRINDMGLNDTKSSHRREETPAFYTDSHDESGKYLKPVVSSLSTSTAAPFSRQVSLSDVVPLSNDLHQTNVDDMNSATSGGLSESANRSSIGIRDQDRQNLMLCLCCPGGVHKDRSIEPNLPTPSTARSPVEDNWNCFDLSNRIASPFYPALGALPNSPDINWNLPCLDERLSSDFLRQLNSYNLMSSNRLLTTFELSIFRTVSCIKGNQCDFSRQPTKCWASHQNINVNNGKRWRRRNPFLYEYKHLLCPKIQSLKDALRIKKDTGDASQKMADKVALQQICFQCEDGNHCHYSHSLEEQMYHPFVYKTQICVNQNSPNGCTRPFCPFLHESEYVVNEQSSHREHHLYNSFQVWQDSKTPVLRPSSPTMPVILDSEGFMTPSNESEHKGLIESDDCRKGEDFDYGGTPLKVDDFINWPNREIPGLENSIYCTNLHNLIEPYRLETISIDMSYRFASTLFKDCREPLSCFELSVFRTTRCPYKTYCDNTKSPTRCWATHASDGSNRWLRRNPWVFNYKHLLCPHVRCTKTLSKDHTEGRARWLSCPKGRNCNLAHSIEEQMYHPFVYKTTSCVNKLCERPFCPFLHPGERHQSFAQTLSTNRPSLQSAPTTTSNSTESSLFNESSTGAGAANSGRNSNSYRRVNTKGKPKKNTFHHRKKDDIF